MRTLTEKVLAVLMQDDTGEGPMGQCHEHAPIEGEWPEDRSNDLRSFELDLLDWGLVYGMAFGIARTEDPFESIESCAVRAADAARSARLPWSGDRPIRRPLELNAA